MFRTFFFWEVEAKLLGIHNEVSRMRMTLDYVFVTEPKYHVLPWGRMFFVYCVYGCRRCIVHCQWALSTFVLHVPCMWGLHGLVYIGCTEACTHVQGGCCNNSLQNSGTWCSKATSTSGNYTWQITCGIGIAWLVLKTRIYLRSATRQWHFE